MRKILFALVAASLVFAGAAIAQEAPPMAEIVNDEGGVQTVEGQMYYTNLLTLAGVAQPLIITEDQAGFVNRDPVFSFPLESQTFGHFTSDPFVSPVSYTLPLPILPQGTLVDVDNNGQEDTGLQVFAIAFWSNMFGDPFLEQRDGYGWSGNLASTLVDAGTSEVYGGKYLIYAPEEGQGFPVGFGDDSLLFTEDDPIVIVPAGYTIVDMDSDPFTFDRSNVGQMDLLEAESAEVADFSELSYTDAFNSIVDLLINEYAFTEFKSIDWEALREEFLPRMEQAEQDDDPIAFEFAMRDFSWSIPDGHVGVFPNSPALDDDFLTSTGGGLGMSLTELDDGRIVITYLTPGGPAEQAGLGLLTEVTAINGEPIDDVVSATVPFSSPFSSDINRRLQQLRYAIRFPVGTDVEITIQNDAGEEENVQMTTVAERNSFAASSFVQGVTGFEPPITYEILPDGYGYVNIYSFFGNEILTVELWEEFLNLVNELGLPGIVIDLRQNGGGSGWLADQLAGYFLDQDEPVVTGYTSHFNPRTGVFETNLDFPGLIYPAPEESRFTGSVVALVGPNCASACEFFAYNLRLINDTTIIGKYPSAGLGGSVDDMILPDGLFMRYTVGRAVGPDQEIHIEGTGVVPNVLVPVDETTVFAPDPILDTAISYLNELFGVISSDEIVITDGGAIAIGDEIEGEIGIGEVVRYTLTVDEDAVVNITLTGADDAIDPYLRVFDADENLIAENDDIDLGVDVNSQIEALEILSGQTVIIEVATYADSYAGPYVLSVTAAE